MSAVGLRERKKEKTREALVRVALRQFAKRGFDRVTVEEIAEACEVSPRTFFRYFATKEDVLFAESDAHRARLLEVLAEQDRSLSPLQGLQSAMRTLAADYTEQRDLVELRHQIITSTPSLRTRATVRLHAWEGEVIEQLRTEGRADGISDLDLRLTVASANTALRVAVETWIATEGSEDLATLVDTAFTRLHDGLGR